MHAARQKQNTDIYEIKILFPLEKNCEAKQSAVREGMKAQPQLQPAEFNAVV